MKIAIIVAVSTNGVIGQNNQLPWHLPADLQFFKQTTLNHCILMGRKTFESIGKPLPKRTSIVLTNNREWKQEGIEIVYSLDEAIEKAKNLGETTLYIIGGAQLFKQTMSVADIIYWTDIQEDIIGDTFLSPPDSTVWKEVSRVPYLPDEKNKIPFAFVRYERK